MSSALDEVGVVARLAAALRAEGLSIGVDRTRTFALSAAACGDLYWAGRLTLVSRAEDLPVYDRVFRGLFADEPPVAEEEPQPTLQPDDGDGDDDGELGDAEHLEASGVEVLRHIAFDRLTPADVAALASTVDRVRRRVPMQRTRRRSPAARGRMDLRRTAREMHRFGGDAMLPIFSSAGRRPQPLTFLVDVSGSMRAASRALLLACTSFVRASPAVEAFTFGTRLTRVTPTLQRGSVEAALDAASELVEDREGGTRIADSIDELLRRHGQSRTVRGAVVVIYSDGLETGDPAALGKHMHRLTLRTRRVVWLNPLSVSPEYQPLAGGMRAALPFVDTFASGHDLATFENVVARVLDEVAG